MSEGTIEKLHARVVSDALTYWRVPTLFPGSTIVCIASGPSLTREDVAYCRNKAHAICVNDAYRLCPWAEVLVSTDARWWRQHKGVPSFSGLKVSVEPSAGFGRRDHYDLPDVKVLRNTGTEGIELDPTGLRTGMNSGAIAIGVAVHLGAKRILILGYDCRNDDNGRTHFFGDHPPSLRIQAPYKDFIEMFRTMVEPLRSACVEVVNCSRSTDVDAFQRTSIHEALR